MKNLQTYEEFLNESLGKIVDFSKSKNIILVGKKTNLLSDMSDRYIHTIQGDETYYFSKGEHFATLFDDDSFAEIRHDGTLNDKGWRKK